MTCHICVAQLLSSHVFVCLPLGYEHQVKAAQEDILKIVRELVSSTFSHLQELLYNAG